MENYYPSLFFFLKHRRIAYYNALRISQKDISSLKSFNYVFAYYLSINVHFFLKIFIFSTLTKASLQKFLLTIFAAIVFKDNGLQRNKPSEMKEASLSEWQMLNKINERASC